MLFLEILLLFFMVLLYFCEAEKQRKFKIKYAKLKLKAINSLREVRKERGR